METVMWAAVLKFFVEGFAAAAVTPGMY